MSGGFLGQPGRQVFTTTDGILGPGKRPIRVYGVYLISGGGGASTVILRDGPSVTSTPQLQLDGTTSKGTNWSDPQGLLFPNGCFVDVDTNTANLTVSYVDEL